MATFKTCVFKNHLRKDGTYNVKLRVTHNRISRKISTPYYVEAKYVLSLIHIYHNVDETLAITDRTYLLYEGKILKTGTAEELAADPMVRKVYLGQHFELKKSHQLTQEMKNRKTPQE